MKTLRIGWLSGVLALAIMGASAWSAEIPATLDVSGVDPCQAAQLLEMAGLPHDEAVARADSLDPVELAQVGQSDLEQKGGIDPLSLTILATAVVILGLMWIFTVCEP